MVPEHITPAGALAHLPTPEGNRFASLFRKHDVEVEYYAPRGSDPQQPHLRDEIYIVVSGTGWFINGDARHPFGPGDFLFVPAGVVHRFEEFSDDFATWVFFFGPERG